MAFAISEPFFRSVISCGADPTGRTDSSPAFAACLSEPNNGDLFVPSGSYKISHTIVKNRNQNLIGSGSNATILSCQIVDRPCIIVADTSGGPNNYNNSNLQDLTLQGPGSNNSSVGVYLGGDPTGRFAPKDAAADGASLVNVRVTGFNRAVVWGNNSWNNKFVRSLIFGNSTGFYVPTGIRNSGENIGITDSAVFNNTNFGIDDHANFEWMLSGDALDYNGTAIQFFGSAVHIVNCHLEQNTAQLVLQPSGSGSLSIRDSTILIQSNTGSDKYVLSLWPQNLQITLDDVSIWSNHPVQYFMRVQGRITGTITGLHGNGNRMIHSIWDTPSQAVALNNSAF